MHILKNRLSSSYPHDSIDWWLVFLSPGTKLSKVFKSTGMACTMKLKYVIYLQLTAQVGLEIGNPGFTLITQPSKCNSTENPSRILGLAPHKEKESFSQTAGRKRVAGQSPLTVVTCCVSVLLLRGAILPLRALLVALGNILRSSFPKPNLVLDGWVWERFQHQPCAEPNPAFTPNQTLCSSCRAFPQYMLIVRFSLTIPEEEKLLVMATLAHAESQGVTPEEYLCFPLTPKHSGLHKFLPRDSQGMGSLNPVSEKMFIPVSHAASSFRHILFWPPYA